MTADEDDAETSFNANSGISHRPASAPRNVTLIHARTRNPRREIASRSAIQAAVGAPACPELGSTRLYPAGKRGTRRREGGRERKDCERERASCNLEKNVRRRSRGALLFVLPADPPTWPLLRAPDQKQPARPSSSSNSNSSSGSSSGSSSNNNLHLPGPSLPRPISHVFSRAGPYSLLSFSARGPASLLSARASCSLRSCPASVSRVRLERAAKRNPINPRLPARGQ